MSARSATATPAHSTNKVWGFIKCLFSPRQCARMKKLLYQYVEGELDPQTQQQLRQHLADCPLCLEYVETYRRTIHLCRCHGNPARTMPPALERKLGEFIHEHPELK
jgi:anti-sigma factor RsiW